MTSKTAGIGRTVRRVCFAYALLRRGARSLVADAADIFGAGVARPDRRGPATVQQYCKCRVGLHESVERACAAFIKVKDEHSRMYR